MDINGLSEMVYPGAFPKTGVPSRLAKSKKNIFRGVSFYYFLKLNFSTGNYHGIYPRLQT